MPEELARSIYLRLKLDRAEREVGETLSKYGIGEFDVPCDLVPEFGEKTSKTMLEIPEDLWGVDGVIFALFQRDKEGKSVCRAASIESFISAVITRMHGVKVYSYEFYYRRQALRDSLGLGEIYSEIDSGRAENNEVIRETLKRPLKEYVEEVRKKRAKQ